MTSPVSTFSQLASATVAAVAPVYAATVANEAGPRELAINTRCPSAVRHRAKVLSMLPDPMIPMSVLTFPPVELS
jgi:hypothetical protein